MPQDLKPSGRLRDRPMDDLSEDIVGVVREKIKKEQDTLWLRDLDGMGTKDKD